MSQLSNYKSNATAIKLSQISQLSTDYQISQLSIVSQMSQLLTVSQMSQLPTDYQMSHTLTISQCHSNELLVTSHSF